MICPYCNGDKKVFGLACGDKSRFVEWDCSACKGLGEITDEQASWIKEGKSMQQERISRDLSMREEAKRRGMSPVLLSEMERGVIEPKSDAMK